MAANTATPSPLTFVGAIITNFMRAMIGAYALSSVLFFLANIAIGEENWVMLAFLNNFAHLIWMPALILLPLCLLLRAWHLTLMLIPVVAIFGFTYGGRFISQEVTIPTDTQLISIATYNMMGGTPQTIAAIRQLDADIIAFQEISPEAARQLDANFADEYPYRALTPQIAFVQGQGIMSRFPIVEDEYWQYDWLRLPMGHQRSLIQLDADTSLVIYNTHPAHPGLSGSFFNPQYRTCEINDILRRSLEETAQVIWLGDFNMPELSNDHKAITQYYSDAFDAVGSGMGWTFPVTDSFVPPFLRLDYAFISRGIKPIRAELMTNSGGSDHFPMRFQFAVTTDTQANSNRIPPVPPACRTIIDAEVES